ncbi:hypothetical protein GCM10010468_55650 [Actinocorallia longicatena]|uniref:Uncharacterized protein n=1 Tax=Actinocorallia longicatena TaxID=111803 RepID=A0ABP6QGZ8_9ACTN
MLYDTRVSEGCFVVMAPDLADPGGRPHVAPAPGEARAGPSLVGPVPPAAWRAGRGFGNGPSLFS